MKKFKVLVETKQLWEIEAEAETAEDAKKIRDDFYEEIQEQCEGLVLQFQQTHPHVIKLAEFFGGDDFTDDDIIDLAVEALPEAERASKCAVYSLTVICPHCGSETIYSDEQEEYGSICSEIDNNGVAVITCDDCGEDFRLKSYKEY